MATVIPARMPPASAIHSLYFLIVKSVPQHLPYQRKRKYKSKCRYHCTHQIIGNFYACPCQFCKEYSKVLTTIVIIKCLSGIPHILGRQSRTSHHGLHKAKVHILFGCMRSRVKARPDMFQKRYTAKNRISSRYTIAVCFHGILSERPFLLLIPYKILPVQHRIVTKTHIIPVNGMIFKELNNHCR